MNPTPRALALWRTTVAVIVVVMTAAFVAIAITSAPLDGVDPDPTVATAADGNPAVAR